MHWLLSFLLTSLTSYEVHILCTWLNECHSDSLQLQSCSLFDFFVWQTDSVLLMISYNYNDCYLFVWTMFQPRKWLKHCNKHKQSRVHFNRNKNTGHWPSYITIILFTFKHRLDSGWYCILASHAKDEINAARHSQKFGQLWFKCWEVAGLLFCE